MTIGSYRRKIIMFAIPIFIGSLFQQLYNAADSLIVGRLVGSNALAAVSSVGNLIFVMIGFFNGMSVGAGVVIARYIGARDREGTQLSVHTAIALGLVSSVVMTVLGVVFAPACLQAMGTPDVVMPLSVTYLRIYFLGSIGLVMYNTFIGILQAAGDSRHPLFYLIVSSVTNVVLDLFFIAVLGYGVGAAALATSISQILSAALSLIRLMRIETDYRVSLRKIRFEKSILKKIIRYGVPSGLQNSIIGFSNVVIQSFINSFGEMAMAGIGAYVKIEGFAFLPVTSFVMTLPTFISQNLGAKQPERARKGTRFGILICVAVGEIIGIIILIGAPFLTALFDPTPEVVAYGVGRAQAVCIFYFLLAFTHVMSSVMRGYGQTVTPMVIMLVCWCAIRMLIIMVVGRYVHNIALAYWVYPITWTMSATALLIAYFKKILPGAVLSKESI